jgi:hypothetical protein
MGYTSTLRSGLTFSGRPKYLHGNALTSHEMMPRIWSIIVLLQAIGYTAHFLRLVTNPELPRYLKNL